ncbi:unnamed protein product [Polarella glacialis]|uniref:Uncharacterized protein n=1 Tax=Polarella glacialis TaxID=89957 RepID=A0A813KYI2_POLGL|nr:unnamed protein product [Polarella glacialis]
MVRRKLIKTYKCKGTANPANFLTKHAASPAAVQEALPALGMISLNEVSLQAALRDARLVKVSAFPKAHHSMEAAACSSSSDSSSAELHICEPVEGRSRDQRRRRRRQLLAVRVHSSCCGIDLLLLECESDPAESAGKSATAATAATAATTADRANTDNGSSAGRGSTRSSNSSKRGGSNGDTCSDNNTSIGGQDLQRPRNGHSSIAGDPLQQAQAFLALRYQLGDSSAATTSPVVGLRDLPAESFAERHVVRTDSCQWTAPQRCAPDKLEVIG